MSAAPVTRAAAAAVPEVGWGDGHACSADEITEAARRELTGS